MVCSLNNMVRTYRYVYVKNVTLFVEQASIVNIYRVYRQRIMRISQAKDSQDSFFVQYYMLKSAKNLFGAGRNRTRVHSLTTEKLELLPGCILNLSSKYLRANSYEFNAVPPPNVICTFTYLDRQVQVVLGFEVNSEGLKTYDKGIDIHTGKATWGAI